MSRILHIDTSAAKAQSNSRKLSQAVVDQLNPTSVTYRDISDGLPIITEAFIGAAYTPREQRSEEQNEILSLSDKLVDEIKAHDIIVLGVPMYNFNIPASLKLYEDLIARVGKTFMYTDTGPKGLIEGKKIIFVLTSGGVPLNSGLPMDHMTASLKTFFNFLGLEDQRLITASGLAANAEQSINDAMLEIAKIA
ncbi:FMN-dependent NADH-azoreductase [Marinicellulosiphila megalodicopiae]|uniref:FMN-dependent NADH-azoreductase n=1 Tax=Marinicellulosiphila megalodicopiae TaxID=2724896 RepID=UPI003BAF0B9F